MECFESTKSKFKSGRPTLKNLVQHELTTPSFYSESRSKNLNLKIIFSCLALEKKN